MKHFSAFLLLLLLTGFWGSVARAQAPDATFAPSSLYAPASVYQILEQSDGKVVLSTGASRIGSTPVGALVRLTATGTVDAVFGQNVSTAYIPDELYALPNNQLLLRGSFGLQAGGIQRNEVLRLNADGTADPSLDAGTGVASSDPNTYPYNNALVVQPDGKMVLAGVFDEFSGVPAHNLVRLNPNGSIDPSFQLVTGPDEEVYTIAQQTDGKLLIGGYFTNVGGVARPGLARLNADGTLDASYVPSLQPGSQVDALRIQPDGNVLIGGFLNLGTSGSDFVARLTAAGARDNTFATPVLNSNLTAGYGLNPFQLQADGKIILVGYFSQVNGMAWPHLVRLNATGTVDASFNPGAGPNNSIAAATLGAGNKLYVGGYFGRFAGQPTALVRLTSAGSIDASFEARPLRAGQVNALVRQADGKTIIGGVFTELNGQPAYNRARLNADGTTDNTYTAPDTQEYGVGCLALQPDGKLLAGASNNSSSNTNGPILQRFTTTGAVDATFQASVNNFSGFGAVNALALQPDGRVLVGGTFGANSGIGTRLTRLLASGQPDGSFAPSSPAGLGLLLQAQALVLQPNGQVLVAGRFGPASGSGPSTTRVFRLETNGTPDAGFNVQPAYTQLNSSNSSVINVLEVQPAGTILVGGQFGMVNGAVRSGLVRLTVAGQLDDAFNANFTLASSFSTTVHTVRTQPNGRVLVGGFFSGTGLSPNLARLLPDGRPDASFTMPLGIGRVRTLAVQPDGKLLAGGTFSNVGGQPYMGVVRLTAQNVLAVSRQQATARLEAWPVPAHDALHLRLDASARPERVVLLDVTGRLRVLQPNPAAELTLSLQGLTPGVYLLRVDYATGSVTRRVVVE